MPDPLGISFFLQGEPCFTASVGWTSGTPPSPRELHSASATETGPQGDLYDLRERRRDSHRVRGCSGVY